MSSSVNIDNNLTKIKNSIFLGGPKHLEIVCTDYNGRSVLSHVELVSMITKYFHPPKYPVVEYHNHYRFEFVIGEFRGYVFFHESIDRSQYITMLQEYKSFLSDKIKFDNRIGEYRFFNETHEEISNN